MDFGSIACHSALTPGTTGSGRYPRLRSSSDALVEAQQSSAAAVAIDNDDIGGVVTGPNGPEAGVWVIAETADLPTRFARIVVTDDQGRYVVPDLPKAKYKRVGARLRPRRFAEGRRRARQAAQPHGGAGAERGGGSAILSGDLLVLDAEDSGRRASSAARATSPRRSPRPTGST